MVANGRSKGVTLVELMVAITISAIIGIAYTKMQEYILRFTLVSKAKQESVQEARTALTVMQKMIQQGSASSFVMDQQPAQPPYSRIYFKCTDMDGNTREFSFYQISRTLYMDYRTLGEAAWKSRILSKNCRFLTFFYAQSSDNRLISVNLTISKKTAEQKETFLQMTLQRIRIQNS